MGLSGGVDSAAAALLLLRQGLTVEAVFMKNWEEDDDETHCAAAQDLEDARAVCHRLGIRLHTVNFAHEYWERVFTPFLTEHQAGRTPNPDILCNREIKFRAFLDYALGLGAEAIATGHYARIGYHDGQPCLQRGCDVTKDQSYFLYALTPAQLARSRFPLGALSKATVRHLARQAALPVHAKPDSTGLCFIGERHFRTFLARFLPAQPGEIVDLDGASLGKHSGLMYYTLGQRQGLNIGGQRHGNGTPWYVADKDLATNRLIVVQGHDHPALFRRTLTVAYLHWIMRPLTLPLRCTAKTRYRQADQACTVMSTAQGGFTLCFDAPQRAVTPGQSVVLYQGEMVLGGGVIETAYDAPCS